VAGSKIRDPRPESAGSGQRAGLGLVPSASGPSLEQCVHAVSNQVGHGATLSCGQLVKFLRLGLSQKDLCSYHAYIITH
jgi:hypothetical protein